MHRRVCAIVLGAALALLGAAPGSASDAAPAPPAAQAPAGLSLDLEYASAYVFRGWNRFQRSSQQDQHALIAPSLSWKVGDIGLALGYWSGYQLTGGNIQDNNDAGVGLEQDLYVHFERALLPRLTLGGGLISYMYPFADPGSAGAPVPLYLEPYLVLTHSDFANVGLWIGYYTGLQQALWERRYLYLNPSLSRGFELLPWLGFDVSASLGYKLWANLDLLRQNSLDLMLRVWLPVRVTGPLVVKPGLSLAWTNLDSGRVAEGLVLWAHLNVGVDL